MSLALRYTTNLFLPFFLSLFYSNLALCIEETSYLVPYRATYLLRWHGLQVGKSTHSVREMSPHHFIAEAISKPSLAFLPFKSHEKSEFTLNKTGSQAKLYTYDLLDKGKQKTGTLYFDRKQKIIYHTRKNAPDETFPLQATTQDKITYIFQLQRDLKNNHHPLYYQVAEPKGLKTYLFTIKGEESLKTPLGLIEVVKLEHISQNNDRKTELWLAKDLGYLLIKLRQTRKGKVTAEALIQTYTLRE